MVRGSARGLAMLVVGLVGCALAGCGGGHSHASTPGATGGASAQPVISGATAAGQATSGSGVGGSVSTGGSTTAAGSVGAQGLTGLIGFPVGPLLPTTVDKGQCQAAQFADKSVYAQIAVVRATCAQVPTVAAGADHARGGAYSAAGFACVATAPQPSNGYWSSEYVSYNCRNGDDQIAFNWGTSSSAF